MPEVKDLSKPRRRNMPGLWEKIKRAYADFLSIPTYVVLGFVLLAIIVYVIDRTNLPLINGLRDFLKHYIFGEAQNTIDFLSMLTGAIITVTSITISILMLTLQQAANIMGDQVMDQFMHRNANQAFFGFFVGLSFYSMLVMASTNKGFNPVIGATLALLLTGFGLYLLVVLIYQTITQMQPEEIIEKIHDETLLARQRQWQLIKNTRKQPKSAGTETFPVHAQGHGFVTGIKFDALEEVAKVTKSEIILDVSFGSYVAYNDVLAKIKVDDPDKAVITGEKILDAITLDMQRDIRIDPAYGIEQFEMVAWTSVSSSKDNPEPGLLTIRSLRDVLSIWLADRQERNDRDSIPVVYKDDVFLKIFDTLGSLAVVSSESLQHQNYTEVLRTISIVYGRLPDDVGKRANDMIRRILSALGDHVLTAELDIALSTLESTLRQAGSNETADDVQIAHDKLKQSIGELSSRSTRVPQGG